MILGTKTDVVLGMHFGMVFYPFGRLFWALFWHHFGVILDTEIDVVLGVRFGSGFELIFRAFEDRKLSHFEA